MGGGGGEKFRALLDDELKMVNWILNSKAPETLETQSQDEIWVMGGCYFGGRGEGGGGEGCRCLPRYAPRDSNGRLACRLFN